MVFVVLLGAISMTTTHLLPSLSPQRMYTLWVCSLLVIPPPIGRMVPQGGFLTDLTELNLLGWANLVQDMAVGLQALPPRLCLDVGTQAVALLQLLEAATGVGFCCHCCHPRPRCTCTGSPLVGSPHIVEPDCSAGPGIWSDLHLWGSNQSEYSHGRYAWIRGTSSRPHPSRFLHLEHTPSGGPSAPRATCFLVILASHGEGYLTEGHYRQAGSGDEGYSTTGSPTIGSKVASPTATGSSDGATLAPATPILWESAGNPVPAGSAAASQA